MVSDVNILQTLGIQASKTIETKESIHFEGFLTEQASNRKKPGFTVQNRRSYIFYLLSIDPSFLAYQSVAKCSIV